MRRLWYLPRVRLTMWSLSARLLAPFVRHTRRAFVLHGKLLFAGETAVSWLQLQALHMQSAFLCTGAF